MVSWRESLPASRGEKPNLEVPLPVLEKTSKHDRTKSLERRGGGKVGDAVGIELFKVISKPPSSRGGTCRG